jgi:hypothetical protein
MAINNTWSVTNMQHTDADGGVFLVYWSMVAAKRWYAILHCFRRRQAAL